MATNTYVALATYTVPSNVASYTFTGISQAYTDLVLISSMQTSINNDAARLEFNGDLTSNYSFTQLYGNGSTATSNRATNQTAGRFANDCPNSGYFATYVTQIQNYSNATTFKTILSRGNAANQSVQAFVTLWRKTPEAITSIKILPESGGTLLSGSTFSLYGIAAEGAPYATGGYVTSDANYYYHTFTSSGTFTPSQALSCDTLVIAGGGAGGGVSNDAAGGGGAGGYRLLTSQSAAASTNYTVTIGAGGSGVANSRGGSGTNSSIVGGALSIASSGGGGGGGTSTSTGATGGSGGGAGGNGGGSTGGTGNAGSYSPVEGYAGGDVYGGGGGATAAGGGAGGGGAGGAGSNSASSWASATGTGVSGYYAGGGSSGQNSTSASGGGGRGETPIDNNNAAAGTTNTGSGGGGRFNSSSNSVGANGGSGIVIVRYAK